jgi:hypothetical protein
VLQRQVGANPFKYGFVGGSDLHSGLSVSSQADFSGNTIVANLGGGKVSSKAQAEAILTNERAVRSTAGSLTGVWAESNTRESIYDALRRRETFATTGSRLQFRFFGGWHFSDALLSQRDWVSRAYDAGVPMGGDLPPRPIDAAAPVFVVWAVKDPSSGNLDRAQIVKVWEDAGQINEKVFDIAWADGRHLDSKTGRLPSIGNTVNLVTGQYTNSIGATQLQSVWKDPEFNPRQFATYYLRVLEIPTPRWSSLLAIETGVPLPKEVPPLIQQRGWSSPIWYSP